MSKEIKNGIAISITVILVIAIVYLTTAVFMTGEIGNNKKVKESKTTTKEASSSVSKIFDNMIIASKTFDQKKDEYMVIFFHGNDISDTLKSAITSYDSSNNGVKLYKVNTDDVINKFVLSDEQNSGATNYKELKINDITLITIKNKSIASYVTEEENVINNLK